MKIVVFGATGMIGSRIAARARRAAATRSPARAGERHRLTDPAAGRRRRRGCRRGRLRDLGPRRRLHALRRRAARSSTACARPASGGC